MPKHLLGIRGLSHEELCGYVNDASTFIEISERRLKKVPALRGKTIINLFLEPSTRTRASFEIAGKRLSADTINISGSGSSIVKGETLLDTVHTLQAMAPDALVIRHSESGAAEFCAAHLETTSVVNAGDGMHEHPTQALLDCLALTRKLQRPIEDLRGLNVAIVGDIRHSRVARSNIEAHRLLGNSIKLVGPSTLVPREFVEESCFGKQVQIVHDLRSGLEGADIVIVLRMQLERQNQLFVPSIDEYSKRYCVSEKILKEVAPKSVVLHPGPANRGIEVSSEVLDGQRSAMREQVSCGVAVRMAVLFSLCTGQHGAESIPGQSVSQESAA